MNVCNLIRIAVGDEQKIAFCTKEGLFEYTVIPFGITNTPVSFQDMMNTIFKDMKRCIWYFNNMRICCGNTEVEYQAIVKQLLRYSVEHGLAVNLLKSEFHVYETIFLVCVINGQEVKMDPSKLETMYKWPILTKNKEMETFTGFAHYFR